LGRRRSQKVRGDQLGAASLATNDVDPEGVSVEGVPREQPGIAPVEEERASHGQARKDRAVMGIQGEERRTDADRRSEG
jgi:hypothetical protein